MTGIFEVVCFAAFLCWIFSERVLSMVDVLSARASRAACAAFGGEPTGESGLRRAALRQRPRRPRDANDNELTRREQQDKQYRIQALLASKEKPMEAPLQGDIRVKNLNLGGACERCTPLSRESWVSGRHNRSHVISILDIGRNSAVTGGFFSRRFCDIVQAYTVHKWDYPQVADTVMLDDRLQLAIEQTTQEEVARLHEDGKLKPSSVAAVKKQVEKKAAYVLDNMKSTLSDFFLRVTSWLLHKLLPRIAPGGAAARAAAVARLRAAGAADRQAPLVLVPLHRSHLDYILVSLVLLNCHVRPPLVAAGDNLRIPLFGWLLRYLGAFFIRRRVEPNGSNNQRDHVYRATLRAYILRCLQARHNLEFFIEGGRTRSGKPQLPKGGILSVIVDAYMEGTIEDALLVPVSMNYEKLVDGNFVREQLGIPKEMETFWSAFKGIWHVLNSNYGSIRVDFNQPFSLRELVTSFQQKNHYHNNLDAMLEYPIQAIAEESEDVTMQQLSHRRQMSSTHSCSSLYGDEMSREDLGLVEAIARHIVYDASKATAIMSTNMVGWSLLTQFRKGCLLPDLVNAVERLAGHLLADGRDLGFSGETVDVVNHAIDVLGKGLVKKERENNIVKIQPVCLLPNVIELSYYSSCLLPHYALQAIVLTAAEVLTKNPGIIKHSSLVTESLCLCEVMSQEFLLAPPCRGLTDCIVDAIDVLIQRDLLQSAEVTVRRGNMYELEYSLGDNEEEAASSYVDKLYSLINTTDAKRDRTCLQRSLQPLIEAYVITSFWLTHSDLIGQSDDQTTSVITEREFVKTIITDMTTAFEQGRLFYGDALSTDAIKNCLRLHKLWGVVDISSSGRDRIITLNENYASTNRLRSVYALVSKFKLEIDCDSPI